MNASTIRQFRFFQEHAGYIVGARALCAFNLAKASERAASDGMAFRWEVDQEIDSSDFSDETPAWELWTCVAYMDDERGDACCVASLCGIDFGRDGNPWNDPYRRVVEAELALEHFGRTS